MSINSLTDNQLRNSKDYRAAIGMIAPPLESSGGNTLSALVKYIPTESVTLYVAALSAAPALKMIWERLTETVIYWFFGILTAVLVMLIYFGKRRVAGLRAIPLKLVEWPWWKTVAATIAFFVWALAVPNNPYVKSTLASALVGFFAIFVSTILSVLEPLFDRPSNP
jgi:hypothetical protein